MKKYSAQSVLFLSLVLLFSVSCNEYQSNNKRSLSKVDSQESAGSVELDEDFFNIVGGEDSDPVHPFVSLLSYQASDNTWHLRGCGATLISSCHVLTAAHCFYSRGRPVTIDGVYVNSWMPTTGNNNVPFHFSEADDSYQHENFDNDGNLNDIAIIKMESCIPPEQKDNYPIMDLADSEFIDELDSESLLTVIGLGALSSGGSSPTQLQTVDVPYIATQDCRNFYGGSIRDDMICAGYEQGGKDSCQGDSGGPLFLKGSDGKRIQVGIVSWGTGCALRGKPGVYASVAYHREWIVDHVCDDNDTDANIELCHKEGELYASCESDNDCMLGLECRVRTFGAQGVCSTKASSSRSKMSEGRGGAASRMQR